MSGYIGPSPVPQSIQRRQTFTATASQTTFGTSGYTDGDFIDVYLNGVKLVGGTDYTATNGSDIVLTTGAAAGDILDFVTFNSFQLNAPSFDDSLTLQNTTEEDTDGGRESTIIFKGEQSGGEISTLAEIEAAHDGTADDEKGDLIFRTNDGADGSAPTERLRIDSAGNVGIGTSSPDDTLTVGDETLTYGSAFSGHTLGLRGGVLGGTAGNETDIAYFGSESTNNNTFGLSLKSYRESTGNDWTTTGLKFTYSVDNSDALYDNMLCFKDGNVGIGTSSPSQKLHVEGAGNQFILLNNSTTNDGFYFKAGAGASSIQTNSGSHVMNFFTSGSERMRIDSSGNLLVGRTNASEIDNSAGAYIFNEGAFVAQRSSDAALYLNRFGSNGVTAYFRKGGTTVGSISVTTSSTSYNTSSDYRLKENVTDVTDGITRVKQLAPKRFNFIADADTTVDGFLAHEAQAVVPEAVTGTHDEVDDDNNPVYQGIDQSKLVPLLTAALQEAITKIETLETEMTSVKSRLDALENPA